MAVLAAYGSDIKKADQLKIILTSKESFYVEADKVRIAQVISNLLNNAMKFTQEGTITISCNRMNHGNEKHSAMFCMKDTGVGIHPEIYPKLFSIFASHSHRWYRSWIIFMQKHSKRPGWQDMGGKQS